MLAHRLNISLLEEKQEEDNDDAEEDGDYDGDESAADRVKWRDSVTECYRSFGISAINDLLDLSKNIRFPFDPDTDDESGPCSLLIPELVFDPRVPPDRQPRDVGFTIILFVD